MYNIDRFVDMHKFNYEVALKEITRKCQLDLSIIKFVLKIDEKNVVIW